MFAGVGERLQSVEHARGRVGDRRHANRVRPLGERLDDGQPPPSAGDDEPQQRVHVAGALDQCAGLPLQRSEVGLQADPRARALQPREVVAQRERAPAVDSRDLERAVAAQEALVAHGDQRLLDGRDRAVQGGEEAHAGEDIRANAPIVVQFHRLFYHSFQKRLEATTWMGVALNKCPTDLWIYQELLHRVRPAVVVETGTAWGGSALYFAGLCELLDHGRIVTIDIAVAEGGPTIRASRTSSARRPRRRLSTKSGGSSGTTRPCSSRSTPTIATPTSVTS